ncbi:hypothetical protein [Puniceicoccus vermicola]|uniref:Type II secretion system protein GspE N-terminal domain-containing protein n=1 Tax=Puniceicoccus vermicola TaxID=388746 RepID=A0A7X1AY76_9BACT|nr:hypothetical protein [Puniceicoccus vermicola]MBC2602185.1 hypothetical protein [Puniceicoccus vermicola]
MPAISKEHKALVLRSNRFLANTLNEYGLVNEEDIDEANERLLDAIDGGNPRQISVLNILIYDLKKLDEKDYINFVVKESKIGLIALSNYKLRPLGNAMNDPDVCWATWTIPFDLVGDYYLVATAYYPSRPVVEYWEKAADKPIIWYGASIQCVTEAIDRISQTDSADSENDH